MQDNLSNTIGRVAAFINYKANYQSSTELTVGGMGFFECINDQRAAFALFDCCKHFLQKKNVEVMDGPINFGERNMWWGLLIDGFDIPPIYGMNYHLPYYKNFFEAYGFQIYFKQFTFGRKTKMPFNERIYGKAKLISQDKRYIFKHIDMRRINIYAEEFKIIYNKAWARHQEVSEMTSHQAYQLIKQLKPIIDPRIIWFGYFERKPIAVFIMLPDVNQIFKHLHGKMDFFRRILFLYYKHTIRIDKMFGLIFGLVPEFQRKGVDGAMIMAAAKIVQKDNFQYKNLELNWIGDFNPKMLVVARQIGGKIVKTHATYRKLFDSTKPFQRMKMIK